VPLGGKERLGGLSNAASFESDWVIFKRKARFNPSEVSFRRKGGSG